MCETDNELRIYTKTMDGETSEFRVTKDTKIKDFIKEYKEYKNMSECTQVLLWFKGKKLDPYKTFDDYDIFDEAIIHDITKLSGC